MVHRDAVCMEIGVYKVSTEKQQCQEVLLTGRYGAPFTSDINAFQFVLMIVSKQSILELLPPPAPPFPLTRTSIETDKCLC